MKLVPIFTLTIALAITAATSPAGAFTQDPIGNARGTSGGQLVAPDEGYGRLTAPSPDGSRSGSEQTKPTSPYSFGVTGGPNQRYSPSIDRSGTDNTHLFWNNNSRWR